MRETALQQLMMNVAPIPAENRLPSQPSPGNRKTHIEQRYGEIIEFERRLAVRGMPPAALARIVCPIGAQPGIAIRSKEPGAIAIAVAAELLALREALAARDGMGASAVVGAPVAVGTLDHARALRAATRRTPGP